MKKLSLFALIFLVPVLCLAQVKQSTDIFIANRDGQVKFKAVDGTMTTTTLPWLEFTDGTNTVFSIPSTGIIPVANGGTGASSVAASRRALGITSGWTNTSAAGLAVITYGIIYSTAPSVVLTPTATNITCHVDSVNTTNATVYLSATNGFYWHAIGAP